MKEKDKEEDFFEDELSGIHSTSVLTKQRLQNTPPNPTMDHLQARIKSKVIDIPPLGKKKGLQDVWNEPKDKLDWECTVFFDNSDQIELNNHEVLLA